MMEYLYDNGVDVIGLILSYQRFCRSVWDGLKFRFEVLSVDWRKYIGFLVFGVFFGVIMLNFLDLVIGNLYEFFCVVLE